MEKRGLSDVITVVLIILIVIISISIIWVFVQPNIIKVLEKESKSGELGSFVSCLDLDIKVKSCKFNLTSEKFNIEVERGGDNTQINKLKFSVDDNIGRNFLLSNDTDIPTKYGSKNYIFNFASIGSGIPGINSVKVIGILANEQACDWSETFYCEEEQGIEDDGGQLENQGCEDYKIIPLSDFNESTCTRTRKVNIPSAGMFTAGTDAEKVATTGSSYIRNIIKWREAYDEQGNLNFIAMDSWVQNLENNDMEFILSLRSNHPEKSTIGFEYGQGRGYDEPDSPPKDEEEWKEYVRQVVSRYQNRGLIAVSLGNEVTQFEVNYTLLEGKYGTTEEALIGEYLRLLEITNDAIKEINPDIQTITPGLVSGGLLNLVLADGFNEKGWRYKDTCDNGIAVQTFSDLNGQTSDDYKFGRLFKSLMIDGSDYYDYLNVHPYVGFSEDPQYTANWIRNIWKENGIQDKGLISLEFGAPFYNYSTEYHSYTIPTTHTTAYHAGWDSITFSGWFSYGGWAINFKRINLVVDGGYRSPLIDKYADTISKTKDFKTVSKTGENTFTFKLKDNSEKIINIGLNVKIPEETCQDIVNICGNAILDLGEECDDGNLQNGDGCNSNCNLEILGEPPTFNTIIMGWDGAQRDHTLDCMNQLIHSNPGEFCESGLPGLASLNIFETSITRGPTATQAGWAQILTGYTPEKTMVYTNEVHRAIPAGHTIFEKLENYYGDNNIETAFLGFTQRCDETICVDCPSDPPWNRKSVPAYCNIGYNKPNSQEYVGVDLFLTGNGDNENVANLVNQIITDWDSQGKKFLIYAHFLSPDKAGHEFGENSIEFSQHLKDLDNQLIRIQDHLTNLGIQDNTYIYLTTDHGFDEEIEGYPGTNIGHKNAQFTFLATDDPGVIRPGNRLDITPTILEKYGVPFTTPPINQGPLPEADGFSLLTNYPFQSIPERGQFLDFQGAPQCEPGLTLIDYSKPIKTYNGFCFPAFGGTNDNSGICTDCGDGLCDQSWKPIGFPESGIQFRYNYPENKCNCPADCPQR